MAIRKLIISKDDSIYEAWPDLAMTESGKLIVVFSECEHHMDRNHARIVLKESFDKGETWGEKIFLTERCEGVDFSQDDCKPYYNCARIGRFKNGNMYVIADKIFARRERKAEIYLWIGDKEGNNWGERIKLPLNGIVPDKITELDSGRIIVSAHFENPNTEKLEQYLIYSDDGMKTWSERITVAAHPDLNLCEVSILQHEGALVAFLRENSRLGYPILKVISYDDGLTWSGIYHTAMDSGHRPVSGKLQNGRVMVTYRYIPLGTNNVFVGLLRSEDLLKTSRQEQGVTIMPLDYDRNQSPDLGYTGWVQFDDGEIFVVNYIKDDSDKAYIRGYKFRMEDVELPVTETATAKVENF